MRKALCKDTVNSLCANAISTLPGERGEAGQGIASLFIIQLITCLKCFLRQKALFCSVKPTESQGATAPLHSGRTG